MPKKAHEIYRLLAQIMKLSFSSAYPKFHELHIHPAQADLLHILRQNPGITQSDLAKRLYIAPSTVAISLNRLEEAGYVYREKGEDKRKSMVFLTSKSAQIIKTVDETFARLNRQLTNTLTEEERASLAALLGKIRDSLIQERTEEVPKE